MILALLPSLFFVPSGEWPAYGLDPGGNRFAVESQITKANVSKLRLAWTFHTHEVNPYKGGPNSALECTPIYVDRTLYAVTAFNHVFAIDPDTGRKKWDFDPKIPTFFPLAQEPFACRGVATWKPPIGHRRIFLATHDARLIALDAQTGKPILSFAKSGTINLRDIAGKYWMLYNETSAPCVIGNLVVVGSSIGDNRAVDQSSGAVRAFDARTGALKWSWDPIGGIPVATRALDPDGGDYMKKAGGSLKTGAGNAWSTISADPGRDMIFVPTGSASPDFCGVLRPGDNADADSVVALRASTGKKIWAFQVNHHDLWDYDVAAQPILAQVSGKPAVVVMTKMGFVFVLDRRSGKPLLPVVERPVPGSSIEGEHTSRTQPFPVLPKPLVPTEFAPWALGPKDKAFIADRLKGTLNHGIFTPPSVDGTIIYPGNLGGCNWSGGSFDPQTNTLFVNTNNLATVLYLIPRARYGSDVNLYRGHETNSQLGTPYGMRREWVLTPAQVPGVKPPWGELNAVDLGTGRLRWKKPLGIMPQYADLPQAKAWGSINLGGSFTTSTGLVFIAASEDSKLRAFDGANGAVLWETTLPAGGQATPMTFRSAKTGRQYVVQCAGGHHGLGTPEGDSIVAYALSR